MQLTTICSYSKVDQRNSSQSPGATTYGKANCQSRHSTASSALSPADYKLCFKTWPCKSQQVSWQTCIGLVRYLDC